MPIFFMPCWYYFLRCFLFDAFDYFLIFASLFAAFADAPPCRYFHADMLLKILWYITLDISYAAFISLFHYYWYYWYWCHFRQMPLYCQLWCCAALPLPWLSLLFSVDIFHADAIDIFFRHLLPLFTPFSFFFRCHFLSIYMLPCRHFHYALLIFMLFAFAFRFSCYAAADAFRHADAFAMLIFRHVSLLPLFSPFADDYFISCLMMMSHALLAPPWCLRHWFLLMLPPLMLSFSWLIIWCHYFVSLPIFSLSDISFFWYFSLFSIATYIIFDAAFFPFFLWCFHADASHYWCRRHCW